MERFEVDLTETVGDGEFPCPKCKEIISPDDDSGTIYDILETEEADGLFKRVVIECKKCGSIIQLKGFGLLEEIGYSEKMFNPNDHLLERIKITYDFSIDRYIFMFDPLSLSFCVIF